MITKITIKGFRSILDIADLELGRVNVFIGENGAGKSNLLEAFGVLATAAEGRVDDAALLRRGVRPGVPALFKTSLTGQNRPPAITLSATIDVGGGAATQFSVSVNNSDSDPEPAWTFTHETISVAGSRISGRSPRSADRPDPHESVYSAKRARGELPEDAGAALAELSAYGIYTPTTRVLRGLEADTAQRDPVGLNGGRLATAIRELPPIDRRRSGQVSLFADLEPAAAWEDWLDLAEWVDDLAVAAPSHSLVPPEVPMLRDVLWFRDGRMRDGEDRLTAYDATEGLLHLLFLAVACVHPKMPRCMAIDSYDVAMHPRLGRAATRLLCRQIADSKPGRQVFLTTHNPLALDGLDLRDDAVRLFAVERDRETTGTVCRPVELDERVLQSDNPDRALSQLWALGYLGGVPDVW